MSRILYRLYKQAYKKWAAKNKPEPYLPGLEKYTPEQLFFISFGQLWCGKTRDQILIESILNDPHSPGSFRYLKLSLKYNHKRN